MREEAVLLGKANSMVGVVTHPADTESPRRGAAAMLLNAGLIHRVGPHRFYVKLARGLARAGILTVRFDASGFGDSPPRNDEQPGSRALLREPQEVLEFISAQYGIERFILVGLCSGAYIAFKTACVDQRVVAAVLMNPLGFTGHQDWEYYVRARHYWAHSFFRPRAWSNLLTGQVNYRRLFTVLSHQFKKRLVRPGRKVAAFAEELRSEVQSLSDRNHRLLLVLSEQDVSVDHFSVIMKQDLRKRQIAGNLQAQLLPSGDHMFTRLDDQQRVLSLVTDWTLSVAGG